MQFLKGQRVGFSEFIGNSVKLLPKLPASINDIRNNFLIYSQPYYKRLIGITKEELYQFDSNKNIEKPIVKNSSLKNEMAKLVDDYYKMEKVDLTEELSEDDLKIIKVRLEALGYLVKKD